MRRRSTFRRRFHETLRLDVPGSVVGPPFSVAVSPDESLALVTANEKVGPADSTKRIPNNTMSVVDLKATPPLIIATLETGKAPAGVSINRAGTLALVANRAEGTVSVFTIQGKTVTPACKVTVADDKSGIRGGQPEREHHRQRV